MFELLNDGFDVTLIPDTSVGYLMSKGVFKKVIVGADRIVKSGHVFNKIGTYQIATLAKKHRVPFYVAAPISTFDFKNVWKSVKVEERPPEEVKNILGVEITSQEVKVVNPAFDCTPPDLVSGIICEKGILRRPFAPKINRLWKKVSIGTGPVA